MFQLRRNWECDVTVSFIDDQGDPAAIDGAPIWTSANPEGFSVVETDDPLTVTVQAHGAVGLVAALTVEADADLGSGIVPVTASEDIQIVSGQATTASFGFGEPRPIEG